MVGAGRGLGARASPGRPQGAEQAAQRDGEHHEGLDAQQADPDAVEQLVLCRDAGHAVAGEDAQGAGQVQVEVEVEAGAEVEHLAGWL